METFTRNSSKQGKMKREKLFAGVRSEQFSIFP